MGARRVWVVVAAVVVAGAVAGGILWGVRDDEVGSGARVAVVGDSVTHGAAADLAEVFTWTSNLEVQGRSGFRTDELLPVAREVVGRDPDVAVFLPGYNDVWQGADTSAAVAEMVELAASVPCAVWLLLPTKGDWPAARMERFNAAVEEQAEDHPSVHVDAAWRDRVDATDGPEPDPELVSDDLVHPTPAGDRALAEVVEAAVRRHCR